MWLRLLLLPSVFLLCYDATCCCWQLAHVMLQLTIGH
jgi:hypothetical protein